MVNVGNLRDTIGLVRKRLADYRSGRKLNEQTTKASLIVPILQSLSWDTNDPDEVQWEYKPKPRFNPVDFSLMLQRTPCLFLEAKALNENLEKDKIATQIISYAVVAGVEWIVLTNGDEYRIYNTVAPVPLEEKLFRKFSISDKDDDTIESTLTLLSKENLQEKKISRLWASHYIDRQVDSALQELLSPDVPNRTIVRAIKRLTDNRIRESEIAASLRRAHIHLNFPVEPESIEKKLGSYSSGRLKPSKVAPKARADSRAVSIGDLFEAGLLRPPVELHCRYRGHLLEAVIRKNGLVEFGGEVFSSLSTAAGVARKPFHTGDLKGRPYPQTNGWTFWKVQSKAGKVEAIDVFRQRYLEQQKS